MAEDMLAFVRRARQMPDKRPAAERARDFAEIYREFAYERAQEQAARCSQCGVPFCQIHCPLQNNIPDWLMLAAAGRMEEAYETAQATNNMPEICGRICPQDRLCEGNCVIEQAGHGTVTIGAVESWITETAWERGWVRPRLPAAERAQSVGIIGAGPAGMAAAEELRARGYRVMVYDRHDRVGGLMIYGIPNFKLDKHVVARRERLLADQGVVFACGVEIGHDLDFAELRDRHDALLIATGVYKARALDIPGRDRPGVVPALDFLIASNRRGLGDRVPRFDSGELDAAGKRVVVIGGGDTAMDCVRTALREGAARVTCLYRRDRENMPGSQREVANAIEEGVEFVWLSAPERFEGAAGGSAEDAGAPVARVRAHRMRLGAPDSSGRQTPEPAPESGFALEADLVVGALGFEPEDLPGLFGQPELALSRHGTLRVSFASMMTSLDGVFAAGDIIRGASLVVWGIRDGRDAAAGIHAYLQERAVAVAA